MPAGDPRACGSCAWSGALDSVPPETLRCRVAAAEGADGPLVTATTRGCIHHEPRPDCLTCGACCREAFDSVPVDDDDRARGRPPKGWERVHDDGWRDLRRVPSPRWPGRTRCAALLGDGGRRLFHCVIYTDRPRACRELEPGSANCLFARRRTGFAYPGPPSSGSSSSDDEGSSPTT